MDDPEATYDQLARRTRRRLLAVRLLRAFGVSVLIVVLYFTLPFTTVSAVKTGVVVSVGLLVVAGLIAWHAVAITRAPYPRLQAIEALTTAFPLFVVVFATAYFLLDRHVPGSFSQPMTRVDALYFTVTVFSTVGFGDIVPVSQNARVINIVQMVLDLVLIGLVVQVLLTSVQAGLARRDAGNGEAGDG